jgi:5-formyl-3-hydroxy-2-methylpyridine 4-carboxylic acid 5-dehydrogenase
MKTVALIGMGTMGPGMAATLARGGMNVRCYDVSAAAREKSPGEIAVAGQVLERIGGPQASEPGQTSVHDDLAETVSGADLIIEAAPENLEVKAQIFSDLEKFAESDAILASNTSGIPISDLQRPLNDPGRVVGMHWSNPPHIIPVIEIIAGESTSPEVVENLHSLVLDLGLVPVRVARDVKGFVENRVLYAIMRECLALVESGVITAEDLDTCVKWGIGFKLAVIPPMQLLDVAGLDIYRAVASYLNQDLDDRHDVSQAVLDLVDRGELGMKTGSGLFSYTPEQAQALRMQRAGQLISLRRTLEGR